jgi:hypothetical protein
VPGAAVRAEVLGAEDKGGAGAAESRAA